MAFLLIRLFESGSMATPLLPVSVTVSLQEVAASASPRIQGGADSVRGATAIRLPPDRRLALLEAGYRRPDVIVMSR